MNAKETYWTSAGHYTVIAPIGPQRMTDDCHNLAVGRHDDGHCDIIVQDQWLVMTVGYFKRLYPETAGCTGWRDRGFNTRQQLARIVAYPFLCMLMAGLFVLFGL